MPGWVLLLLIVAAPQQPLRAGTDVASPVRKKSVAPLYPGEARRAWIQGIVGLDIVIGPEGTVEDIVLIRSIPALDQAAIEAVRQWEFEPVVVDARAVRVVMTVGVSFTIPNADEWLVHPEGEPRLKLEDFFLRLGVDGSRTYSGTLRNVSESPISRPEAIVSYRRNASSSDSGTLSGVEPPRKLKNVAPRYPDIARGRVQGRVVLEADVDERGIVASTRVLRSIPPLDPAAIEAVHQWEYEPARRSGVAVPFLSVVTINFSDEDIDVVEGIAAELGRFVAEPLHDLEPGAAREFSLSLPAPDQDGYYDVQLRFVVDENGLRQDIPTSRQRKTISSR